MTFFPVKKKEEEESSLNSKEKIALKRWMKLQKMSQAHALFTFFNEDKMEASQVLEANLFNVGFFSILRGDCC